MSIEPVNNVLSKLYQDILERDVDDEGRKAYSHLLKKKNTEFYVNVITNALKKSQEYSELQKENSIPLIDVFMCLRNNENTLSVTFDQLRDCEEHFASKLRFNYYIYENDSIDNTPSLIKEFMQDRKGIYVSDKLAKEQWRSVADNDRSKDMAQYRNSMKGLCKRFKSTYTLIIDSEVTFSHLTLDKFITLLDTNSDIAMTTPFGHIANKPHKYYDTYALNINPYHLININNEQTLTPQ